MPQKKASEKKKTETVEVIEVQEGSIMVQAQHTTPADIISQAISGGADLDKIEKLMLLQEKWEEKEAKKAYTEAMAAFKADPPRIEKTKQVGFESKKAGGSSTSYKHADLATASEKINKAMSVHGLSAAWIPSQANNLVKVTCTITHKLGHSESCTLEAAPDNTGNKNSIQMVGSTITYLERYTLLALTGLATHDMDDDGKGAGPGITYISEGQANELHAMITENLANDTAYLPWLLNWLDVESIETIPAKVFAKAKSAIKDRIKKQNK